MQIKQTTLVIIAIIIVVAAITSYFAFLQPQPAAGESDTSSQAKINIDEICQGALAYMSFPSSVEAEAFVQECKEGTHPEVIDRWKQDNGITDDRAI